MSTRIGFLLYPNVQPLDVIGPWEVFASWKNLLSGSVDLCLLAERPGSVDCDNQVQLTAHYTYEEAPGCDVLLIPGGRGRIDEANNPATIDFIASRAGNAEYVLSVCTGAFLLDKAGLLTGRKATTYWRALPEFKAKTDAQIDEQRVVKSGKYWFSGGITSGIDLALEFISHKAGSKTAGQVQLLLEYFPDSHFCDVDTLSTIPPNAVYPNNPETHLPQYVELKGEGDGQ